MGLGMSIVYGIIVRNHGSIDVDSSPGEGTRITLLLPACDAPERAREPEPEPPSVPDAKVLVVDDDDGVRELLHDLLGRAGFSVRSLPDGASALAAFEQEPADVVLTDLGMSPITGYEVARAVKARSARTQVLLVTGWADEIEASQAHRLHVDAVLTKPFETKSLVAAVARAALESRRVATP